jgi:hypothetical protein
VLYHSFFLLGIVNGFGEIVFHESHKGYFKDRFLKTVIKGFGGDSGIFFFSVSGTANDDRKRR